MMTLTRFLLTKTIRMTRINKEDGVGNTTPVFKNRRKTTPIFIQQAKEVHGERYDYSLVEYVNAKTSVKIICKKHGIFEVSPKSHLTGVNCRKCAYEENAEKRTWNTEKFLKKAKEVHGDTYDYSETVVTKADHKCTIICKKHGRFRVKPTTHCLGIGCRKCAGEYRGELNRVGVEEFVNRAVFVHGDKYDYSLVDYRKGSEKVQIVCKEHGIFEQAPNSHIAGSNCPRCAQLFYESNYWDVHPETSLYLLTISFSGYSMVKVGISKDLTARVKLLHKDLRNEQNVSITVDYIVSGDSESICKFEDGIHNSPDLEKIFVGVKFGGYTECYSVKYKQELLERIKEFEKTLDKE